MAEKVLIITSHAIRRYTERIMGKSSELEINKFIATNEEKIKSDIRNMMDHAEFLYYGKVGGKDNTPVNVFLSGTWVLLLDVQKEVVITLYKINFNVGEEFNKEFVGRVKAKIKEDQEKLSHIKEETAKRKTDYESIIAENKQTINEYKSIIKKLEKTNEDYQEIVNEINLEYTMAELDLRHDVETLVLKKEF